MEITLYTVYLWNCKGTLTRAKDKEEACPSVSVAGGRTGPVVIIVGDPSAATLGRAGPAPCQESTAEPACQCRL